MASKSFGTSRPQKPHLLQRTGGIAAEVQDVRDDIETGFQANEARTGFPRLEWIDGGAPAAAGGDAVLKGTNLLQGQTFDGYVVTQSAIQLGVYALKPGDSGLTVEVVAGAGALDIDLTDGALTITLAAGGSTADAVATAINADGADTEGYIRANVIAGGTLTLAVAKTPMTGGVGDYDGNTVLVSGVECLPANETGTTSTAKWSDTVVTVAVPDLTGETDARAATDIAGVQLTSNGVVALPLAVALA